MSAILILYKYMIQRPVKARSIPRITYRPMPLDEVFEVESTGQSCRAAVSI